MKTALLCVALVAAPASHLATAECIIPPPPCEALALTTLVAVVDVLGPAPLEKVGADGVKPIPRGVKLKVIERFKGVLPEQREITATISINAETVFLEIGKRYLLYAIQNKDGSWTTSCSRTKLVDLASAELSQLRLCIRK